MKNKVISVVAVLLLVGMIYTGIVMNPKSSYTPHNSDKNIIMEISSEYDSIYDNSDTSELEGRSELIIIGTIERIDGAINYSEKLQEYVMTSTIGRIRVNEIIKTDDNIIAGGEIDFIRNGGTISVAEYEKSLTPRQVIRQGLDQMTQEEKENRYVKVAYMDDVEIEVGKEYLMYLKYDENMDRYRIIGMQYGLLEYNESTHQIKNNETKKWETIQYNI